jgi:hypothetical protein
MDGLSDEVHGSKLETLHFIVQLIQVRENNGS